MEARLIVKYWENISDIKYMIETPALMNKLS